MMMMKSDGIDLLVAVTLMAPLVLIVVGENMAKTRKRYEQKKKKEREKRDK